MMSCCKVVSNLCSRCVFTFVCLFTYMLKSLRGVVNCRALLLWFSRRAAFFAASSSMRCGPLHRELTSSWARAVVDAYFWPRHILVCTAPLAWHCVDGLDPTAGSAVTIALWFWICSLVFGGGICWIPCCVQSLRAACLVVLDTPWLYSWSLESLLFAFSWAVLYSVWRNAGLVDMVFLFGGSLNGWTHPQHSPSCALVRGYGNCTRVFFSIRCFGIRFKQPESSYSQLVGRNSSSKNVVYPLACQSAGWPNG
mmetsp:Transcript_65736/g.102631  ORF Transcript_65736/g.102631 Transcript_65736/m.102631 type:complete len:253 (+) Transcript_65736:535-1293(+)